MSTGDPSAAGAPPPGWYPDPQAPGRQRYWDGGRWTEHVHPPAHQAPAAQPAPAGAVPAVSPYDADARQWATFAHLSALLALLIGLPWVGPLIIYLVKKDTHPFIADQGREALNFNLSVFLYGLSATVVTFILTFILIGFLLIPLLIGIGIAWLVLVIIASVRANAGQGYRYPLTIRFVS